MIIKKHTHPNETTAKETSAACIYYVLVILMATLTTPYTVSVQPKEQPKAATNITGSNGALAQQIAALTALKSAPFQQQQTKALELLASGGLVQQAASIVGKGIADSPKLTLTFTHLKALLAAADKIPHNEQATTSIGSKTFSNTIPLLEGDLKALDNEYYLFDSDKRAAKNTLHELMPLLRAINTILKNPEHADTKTSPTKTGKSTQVTIPAGTKPAAAPEAKPAPAPTPKPTPAAAKPAAAAPKPAPVAPAKTAAPSIDVEAQKKQLSYEIQTVGTAVARNLAAIQDNGTTDMQELNNVLKQWKKLTTTPQEGPFFFIEKNLPSPKNKDLLSIITQCKEINSSLIPLIQNIVDFKLDPSFDLSEEDENNKRNALLLLVQNNKLENAIRKITPKKFKTKAEEAAYYIALASSMQLQVLVENLALIQGLPD